MVAIFSKRMGIAMSKIECGYSVEKMSELEMVSLNGKKTNGCSRIYILIATTLRYQGQNFVSQLCSTNDGRQSTKSKGDDLYSTMNGIVYHP